MNLIRILMIITAGIFLTIGAAFAYDSGDFQIWNINDQEIGIGKATKFTMQEEFRYGNNANDIFYRHYDWGFAWAFDKRFELAAGYRFITERAKRKWMETDETYAVLTGKIDLGKFRFEDRNRIEYKHFRFADDHIRYRNRFLLKYPIEFKTITISPFTSNEIFIVSNGTGWSQNRFESGLEFGLTKYVKATISYMQQQIRKKGSKWSEVNVLCIKSKIMF